MLMHGCFPRLTHVLFRAIVPYSALLMKIFYRKSIYKLERAVGCMSVRISVSMAAVSVAEVWTDQLRAASLHFWGSAILCHKRIVTMTKVYIASNNMHLEIIRFRKKYRL